MYYRRLIKQVDTVGKIFREAEKRKKHVCGMHTVASLDKTNCLSF